jgi:hypothetical protein
MWLTHCPQGPSLTHCSSAAFALQVAAEKAEQQEAALVEAQRLVEVLQVEKAAAEEQAAVLNQQLQDALDKVRGGQGAGLQCCTSHVPLEMQLWWQLQFTSCHKRRCTLCVLHCSSSAPCHAINMPA